MGNLVFQATLGGQVNLVGPNTASTYNLNVPAVAGTLVTTGDTGTVTNTMLAGSIANAKLLNSSVTIGSTSVALGATAASLSGLTDVSTSTLTASSTVTVSGGTANGVGYLNGSKVLTTGSGLQFDGTNLGLGVTPSAWNLGKAFEVGYAGNALWATSGNDVRVSSNMYYNSGYKYSATGQAAIYIQGSGVHTWYNSISGTAGNPISLTQAMTLDASGNLLVQATSSSATSVVGHKIRPDAAAPFMATVGSSTSGGDVTYSLYSTGAAAYRFYVGYNGTISATSIVISAISDQRLKENVRDLDTGLGSIMALKPRRFDWKEGKGQDKKDVAGFIAQEFETVFPECVGTTKAGGDGIEYKNINHETLIPTLVKAIQEQQAIIEELKSRLATAGI